MGASQILNGQGSSVLAQAGPAGAALWALIAFTAVLVTLIVAKDRHNARLSTAMTSASSATATALGTIYGRLEVIDAKLAALGIQLAAIDLCTRRIP